MGTELKRIEAEFILKFIQENGVDLNIQHSNKRFKGQVGFFDDNKLVLQSPDLLDGDCDPGDFIDVRFSFHEHLMTFSGTIHDASEERITMSRPKNIFRDLTRTSERIRSPEGMRLSFKIEGEEIFLDYPNVDEFVDVEQAPESTNGFDAAKIADLLKSFRERAAGFSSENKIVMFRERRPEVLEELLLSKTGKMVVYPGSFRESSRQKYYPTLKMTTPEETVLHFTENGTAVFDALSMIEDHISKKKDRNIAKELYCPILFYKYVVGYLYLIAGPEHGDSFENKTIHFVQQFARILAYSLKINGYFKPQQVVKEVNTAELIDISATGLLFSYPIGQGSFAVFDDLEMVLHINERKVPIIGRIMRKYEDSDHLYLGVQFMEMDTGDQFFLERYLYSD